MNILCRLGLHRWNYGHYWDDDAETETYYRVCERCFESEPRPCAGPYGG